MSNTMPRRRTSLLVISMLTLLPPLLATIPRDDAQAAVRAVGPLSPARGALFGAFAQPWTGWDQDDYKLAVNTMESDLGRKLDVSVRSYGFEAAFPSWQESWDGASGRNSLIDWGAEDVAAINSGAQDDLIRARADGVKALGRKVFVRWFQGMDADSFLPLSRWPTGFINAWRRIHGIFEARGATNAAWVWCPTAEGFGTGEAPTWYPGDEYVDWVCADGYNWAPEKPGAVWRPFANIYQPFYSWATTKAKPIMMADTGVLERNAGEKGDWFADAQAAMKTSFPLAQAFVYYNAITGSYNWRYTTSPTAKQSFITMGKDLHFNSRAGGALFGAYVQPVGGWSQTQIKSAIQKVETDIERKLDIDQHYYDWGLDFPSWKEPWDLSNGRIPLIGWNGGPSAQINAGTHDAYIRARADEVNALNGTVFLRYFYEMDALAVEDTAGTPAQFIASWKRIQNIFNSRGATNVEWVWCGTAWGFETGRAQSYYPGDAFVDYICADGYNWAPTKPGAAWKPFEAIYDAFYTWGAPRTPPLYIAEIGAIERSAGEKAAWITDARQELKTRFTEVKAFVWFDSISTSHQGGTYDWRVDSSPATYLAYENMGKDPYFRVDHDLILG